MAALTLSLTALGSLAILLCRPSLALCVYCAGLFLSPPAPAVQLGTADFPLGRILILAVLANAILRWKLHRSFRWVWMDTLLSASHVLDGTPQHERIFNLSVRPEEARSAVSKGCPRFSTGS